MKLWITLDVDGAQPMEVTVTPVRVIRDVRPSGIRYLIAVPHAEVPDPSLVRAIKLGDRDDGHATGMRARFDWRPVLACTEIEFCCQETRPALDALAAIGQADVR